MNLANKLIFVVLFCSFVSLAQAQAWAVITTFSDSACLTPVAKAGQYYQNCLKRSAEETNGNGCTSIGDAYYQSTFVCEATVPGTADFQVQIGYYNSDDCTVAGDQTYLYYYKDANYAGRMVAPEFETAVVYNVSLECSNNGTLIYEFCSFRPCEQTILTSECVNPLTGSSLNQLGCDASAPPGAEPTADSPLTTAPSSVAPVVAPAKKSTAMALGVSFVTLGLAVLAL